MKNLAWAIAFSLFSISGWAATEQVQLTLGNPVADYNWLNAPEQQGWEDVNNESKSMPGLYCYEESQSIASCEVNLDQNLGVLGVSASAASATDSTRTFILENSQALYFGFLKDVPEKALDDEGYTAEKNLPGVSCSRSMGSVECIVIVDRNLGVLR